VFFYVFATGWYPIATGWYPIATGWYSIFLQLAGILFATGWYSIKKKVNKIKGLSLWITRLLLLLLLLRVEEEKRKEKSNSINFFRYFILSLIKKDS
jgi:hypothetical protein